MDVKTIDISKPRRRYYSDESFTTTELDDLNLNQLYNQYRAMHKLPFPDEIRRLRERYDLSATKMSDVLGFGPNSYRNYENGEVPNMSNSRLIQLVKDANLNLHCRHPTALKRMCE